MNKTLLTNLTLTTLALGCISTPTFAVEKFFNVALTNGGIPATTAVGQSYTATYTITNTSTSSGFPPIPLSGFTVSPTNSGANIPTALNSCLNAPLAQKSTCSFEVTYTPTVAGATTLNVNVGYLGDQHPNFVSIDTNASSAGSVIGQILPPIDSNKLPSTIDTSETRFTTVEFTNPGQSDVTINTILPSTVPSSSNFTVTGGNCRSLTKLNGGQTCTIEGTFKPSATLVGNNRKAIITMTYNGSSTAAVTQSVNVTSGQGTTLINAAPNPAIPKQTIVGDTYDTTIQYTNISNTMPAAISLPIVTTTTPNSSAFTVKNNGCGTTVAPSSSCSITYTFKPTSAIVGSGRSATATVNYDSGNKSLPVTQSNITVNTTGSPIVTGTPVTGKNIPNLTTAEQPVTTEVEFTNTTTTPTTVNSVTALSIQGNTTAFQKTVDSCSGKTLEGTGNPAKNTCTVTASFTPPQNFLNQTIEPTLELKYDNNGKEASVGQSTTVQSATSTGIKAIEVNYPTQKTAQCDVTLNVTGVKLPIYVFSKSAASSNYAPIPNPIVSAFAPASGSFACGASHSFVSADPAGTDIKLFAQSTTSGWKSCIIAVNSDGSINNDPTKTTCLGAAVQFTGQQGLAIGLGPALFNGANVGSDAPPSIPTTNTTGTRTITFKNSSKYKNICITTKKMLSQFTVTPTRLTACENLAPNTPAANGDVRIPNTAGSNSYTFNIASGGLDSRAFGVIAVQFSSDTKMTAASNNLTGKQTVYQSNFEWDLFPNTPNAGSNRTQSVQRTNVDASGVNGTNISYIMYPTGTNNSHFCQIGSTVGYFDENNPMSSVMIDQTKSFTELCDPSALQPQGGVDGKNQKFVACASPCAAANIADDKNRIPLACCATPYDTPEKCDNPSEVPGYDSSVNGIAPRLTQYVQNILSKTKAYYGYAYSDQSSDYNCDPNASYEIDFTGGS